MKRTFLGLSIACALPAIAVAADFSPTLKQPLADHVYWGDTHLHTMYSTDAGMIGNNLSPDDALRFAKGETVTSSLGMRARLRQPLDFLVVADHAENLGLPVLIRESNPELLKEPWGKAVHDLVKAGKGWQAYAKWGMEGMAKGKDPMPNPKLVRIAWEDIVEQVDQHNQPGRFTAFHGFEWTSTVGAANLHRNVIFRDGKDKALQVLPLSTFDTNDPERLWDYLETYEQKTGGKVLAIPHNGNISQGLMFDDVTLTDKRPLDKAYAERRMRWEPLYEVTQIKGDGETHPALSATDEFADFYTWDKGDFGFSAKTADMLPREYARSALKRGLAYEEKLGANPFQFGMIGATDSHTGLASAEEDNFFGKFTGVEPGAGERRYTDPVIQDRRPGNQGEITMQHYKAMAGGLAGIWAHENTREALWDAMARKEVYASTGTRLTVRVFAGQDFSADDLNRSDFAANGYAKGVPMGGQLQADAGKPAPMLLIQALREPDGANLDRIQVIKGWLDSNGAQQEQVYDVAWSGERKPDANGKLPAVGNTVNVEQASYRNSIGAPMLQAAWRDPDFDPQQRAFYYVRVLEIPTPSWLAYDRKQFGLPLPADAQLVLQERAYTSPVWIAPR
ncbi:DUF3604 domain-containing protein [Pseudomonas sp. N040]|uniref:DUF3604 domain-containing protein n=1 Tax=Pseudomonas sp. N040 TaxID=2785325 RepID=UPI0018A2F441|nr:DUF3604 domain-containing protein [Pseudomonas sp. N040]MBF7729099.1 DUF3604 domain-containing protein [Pseudomonas sp. N040]MBW7012739.1 DUF3604 domain-containing protein [Pseudomonas sp. N040]